MLPGSLAGVPDNLSTAHAGDSSKPQRLLVCHIASGDRWAGAEVQIASLLGGLSGIEGIEVYAIVLNEGRLAEEARRWCREVKVLPEREMSFMQICSEAKQFAKGRGFRVLHSHRYKENLLAVYLAWKCAIPIAVRTQHGLPEPFAGFRQRKQTLMQFLDRLTGRFSADRVIGVSFEMQDYLIRKLGRGKVAIIHNGLDVARVHSELSVPEAKAKLGIPAEDWVMGTAGRLEPIKRLDIFLDAARHISIRLPKAIFLIVGEGSEEARLRDLAQVHGIGDRVLFTGNRDDIYDVLRAMDVFVLSSDHEGLPMVLLEALYLGVPVVARRVGGIPEVIQDGVSGDLVDSSEPADLAKACLGLLSDEPRRLAMARAGVNVVAEKFSARQTAAQVAQLYKSLCEAK
jgi:L-malate glycosyltransferase